MAEESPKTDPVPKDSMESMERGVPAIGDEQKDTDDAGVDQEAGNSGTSILGTRIEPDLESESGVQRPTVEDYTSPMPSILRSFTASAVPTATAKKGEDDAPTSGMGAKSTTWPRVGHNGDHESPSREPSPSPSPSQRNVGEGLRGPSAVIPLSALHYDEAVAGPSTVRTAPESSPNVPIKTEVPTSEGSPEAQEELDIDAAIMTRAVHFFRQQESPSGRIRIQARESRKSVHDLLNQPLTPLTPLESGQASGFPFLRWYHLPANNMVWVEKLIKQVYAPERIPPGPSENDDRIAKDISEAEQMSLVERLLASHRWTRRQYDNPEGAPGARCMNPMLSKLAKSHATTKKDWIIFMPYLHWETFSAYQNRLRSIDAAVENIDHSRRQPPPEEVFSPFTKAKWQRQMALFKMKKFQAGDKVDTKSGKAKAAKPLDHIVQEDFEDRLIKQYLDYSADDRVNSGKVGQRNPLLLQALHVRRTLDRSYYYALEEAEIRKRDVDQVLYRHTYHELELYDPMMIMIDQLWLWVIDEQTVVSAFPRRWGLDSKDGRENTDVQERIIQAIFNEHRGLKTAEHLASVIVDKCSGVFFPEAEEEHDSVDYLNVFAVSIARLAYNQTKAFNDFCDDSRRPSKQAKQYDLQNSPSDSELRQREAHRKTCSDCGKIELPVKYWYHSEDHLKDRTCLALPDQPDYQSRGASNTSPNNDSELHAPRKPKSLVDISQETEYVKEIKDILDELNSMARVFEQQSDLLKSQRTTNNDDLYDVGETYALSDVYAKVEERLATIKQLQREADRVYSALRDLLDLKQKQASVKQTDDTAQQGLTILVFTIITIIFSPLSFIAAIFSMNAREINDTKIRPLSKIWKIMFPVTVGVLALSLMLAFSINPVMKGLQRLADNAFKHKVPWWFWRYNMSSSRWFSSSSDRAANRRKADQDPSVLELIPKVEHGTMPSGQDQRQDEAGKESKRGLASTQERKGKKIPNVEETTIMTGALPIDKRKGFNLFKRQKKTESNV